MRFPSEWAKLGLCIAAFLFLSSGLAAPEPAPQDSNPKLEQTRASVRSLARQFPAILAPTPLESQLHAQCAVNCTAVADPQKRLTVAQELENIEASTQARLARVGAEIQRCVDDYVMSLPAAPDQGLDRKFVASELSRILSGVADPPPKAFVLSSDQGRSILIFDNVQNGTVGSTSSYAALTAFNVAGQRLVKSDSTGGDMDGYGRIDLKQLNSPVQGEIWLLFSGYMTGANGPNCRMRIFAYDGKRFRTVWAPTNIWGSFTTQVTRDGFAVRGQYYQSTRSRNDRYQLSPDGLYLAPLEN